MLNRVSNVYISRPLRAWKSCLRDSAYQNQAGTLVFAFGGDLPRVWQISAISFETLGGDLPCLVADLRQYFLQDFFFLRENKFFTINAWRRSATVVELPRGQLWFQLNYFLKDLRERERLVASTFRLFTVFSRIKVQYYLISSFPYLIMKGVSETFDEDFITIYFSF